MMHAAITLWDKHMHKTSAEEIFGLLMQPVMWIVLFGIGMKSAMGDVVISGGNYISFITPGIIALSALSGAISGGTVWLDERTKGIVKEYLVAPIPKLSILLGNAMTIVTKSLVQAFAIFLVGLLAGMSISLNPLGWLVGLILVIGYGMGFAGIALAFASIMDNMGAYHAVIFIFNLPLLFLSNALYPLDEMPLVMRVFAYVNPTSYVVDGLRQTILAENSATLSLPLCLLVTALFALFGLWLSFRAFKKSLGW